jgi:glycosyltransferase involved in cell wall biosynthesis
VKVALCTKWADEPYTGVGLYTRQLAVNLIALSKREDVELTLVHKDASGDPIYRQAREWRYRGLPGPLWLMSQERALERVSRQVDIVHEPYLGVRRKLDSGQVVTVHDTVPLDFPAHSPAAFRTYFRRAMPSVLERADAVIVNSNTTKADVIRHFAVPREKVHVTYLGCDHIAPAGPGGQELRASLGVDRAPYFLTVGTLGTKNLPFSLAAIKGYRERYDRGARLVVAGALPKAVARQVRADPALRDGVVELGRLPPGSLPALYEGALAVVCPSLHEGFGFVPLEAMRLGVPAIVSGAGALPEVCGEGATVVPLDDPQVLADAMAAVREPATRARLVARGKARADRFLWRNTAMGTLLVYRRTMGGGG